MLTSKVSKFNIKFYINTDNGDTYLTKKEVECVYWALMGKSTEIGSHENDTSN